MKTFASALAAIAFTFGSGINPLRTRPRRAIDRLALAMWIESGVLLVAAIALQFDGMERTLSWLVLGAAAVEIGRRLEAKGIERYGLVQLALGLAALLTIDALRLRTGMPVFSTLPFGAGSGPRMWDVLLAIAAVAFLVAEEFALAGVRIQRTHREHRLGLTQRLHQLRERKDRLRD